MKKGFSLIELIVVVMIIGILSAIAVVGLTRQQQKARDTRRKADIGTVNTALQTYIADHIEPKLVSSYTISDPGGWDYSSELGGSPATDFMTFLKSEGYLASVPVDPINNGTGDVHYVGGAGYAYAYFYYADAGYAAAHDINGYTTYQINSNLETSAQGYGITKSVRKR